MHYVLFLGIFGLPVVACAGMLVVRVLDTFASEGPPESDPIGTHPVGEMASRVGDLADTFLNAPAEYHPKA